MTEAQLRRAEKHAKSECRSCDVSLAIYEDIGHGRLREYCDNCKLRGIHVWKADQRKQFLEAQGGVCAICGTDDPGSSYGWSLDHDHSCCPHHNTQCGECARGVLCWRCNLFVGFIENEPELHALALNYLGLS